VAQALSSTVEALHEDLADELALLDNENTIFTSTVQSGGRAENSVYSRVADAMLSGRMGARSEGSATTRSSVANQFTNRKKINGVVQEKRETWGVSKRMGNGENPAGMKNIEGEMRYRGLERHKQGKEITYLSQQVQGDDTYLYNDEDGIVQAHSTQGASAWIESSAQKNSEYAVNSNYRPASTHIVNVATYDLYTEAQLREQLRLSRVAKRKKSKLTCFATTQFADHLATFFDTGAVTNTTTPIRRFNQDSGDHAITSMLTGYTTAHGTLMVVPTELLNGTRNGGSLAGASTTNTNTTMTVTSTAGLQSYQKVAGTGITAGTYIASITNATTLVLSAAATATGTPTLTLGEYDHALFLEMEYFFELLNGLEEVDLSPDGSGTQGFVNEFFSLFCSMPKVHCKVVTQP